MDKISFSLGGTLFAALAGLMLWAPGVQAQSPFQARAIVNDRTITRYELDQRILLLETLRTGGDLTELALERLIDERLQLYAADRLGIAVSPEDLSAGIDEFASRANLTGEQLLTQFEGAGIAPQSFRDFVLAGVAWRQVVRGLFGAKSRITDAEIDRVLDRPLENPGNLNSVRVLISELFLRADSPEALEQSEVLAGQLTQINSISDFAAAAREYSVGQSRDRGGRVESWVPLANLPAPIAAAILTMKPGEVTDGFPVQNAIALFQLRALEEIATPAPANVEIEYATFYVPGGRTDRAMSEAAKIVSRADTCDDLYGLARKLPPETLERETVSVRELPNGVALELAKLDVGEISTALTTADGQNLMVLMLCARTAKQETEPPTRDAVQQRLFNERLAAYADAYLAELKADAIIRIIE